ncbi:MAG: DUF4065 domain-containing protein [Desulfovibrionaceae bacterium]|nr:DUF4065 domain-containing protein [Desulfovibrionaceae bacterium]
MYYAQAWHLVWEETPLFDVRIEAWANGPVCPRLYARHKGKFKVGPRDGIGNAERLLDNERESIDAVLDTYGDKTAQYLVLLSHMEAPWKKARKRAGVRPGERCNQQITITDMIEYYSGLLNGE